MNFDLNFPRTGAVARKLIALAHLRKDKTPLPEAIVELAKTDAFSEWKIKGALNRSSLNARSEWCVQHIIDHKFRCMVGSNLSPADTIGFGLRTTLDHILVAAKLSDKKVVIFGGDKLATIVHGCLLGLGITPSRINSDSDIDHSAPILLTHQPSIEFADQDIMAMRDRVAIIVQSNYGKYHTQAKTDAGNKARFSQMVPLTEHLNLVSSTFDFQQSVILFDVIEHSNGHIPMGLNWTTDYLVKRIFGYLYPSVNPEVIDSKHEMVNFIEETGYKKPIDDEQHRAELFRLLGIFYLQYINT